MWCVGNGPTKSKLGIRVLTVLCFEVGRLCWRLCITTAVKLTINPLDNINQVVFIAVACKQNQFLQS
jgi:hypothetical protein